MSTVAARRVRNPFSGCNDIRNMMAPITGVLLYPHASMRYRQASPRPVTAKLRTPSRVSKKRTVSVYMFARGVIMKPISPKNNVENTSTVFRCPDGSKASIAMVVSVNAI